MTKLFRKTSLLILLLLIVSSCHLYKPLLEGIDISKRAAEKFHAQFNDQKYREIYLQADSSFREKTKESVFIELLEAVSRKIGKVVSSNETGSHANGYESTGITVSLQLRTTFTGGDAAEQFVWLIKNNEAKLVSYTITSPDLIRK